MAVCLSAIIKKYSLMPIKDAGDGIG